MVGIVLFVCRLRDLHPANTVMHLSKRHIAFLSLLCACFLMLATTVLPHHHHDDGRICFALVDISHAAQEHSGDASACHDGCLMKLGVAKDVSLSDFGSKGALFAWVAVLPDLVSVPDAGVRKVASPYIYIESPCKCIVCTLCGLRAPPLWA